MSRWNDSSVIESESGSLRSPVSRASIRASSSVVSSKLNTSKFAAIRSGLTDLGIAGRPSWRCQRSMTCAGDLPCAAAISPITGS